MKVYSIGREMGCDIIINDNSDVVMLSAADMLRSMFHLLER